MKISIMPKTKNGKMSVRLIVLFGVFLTIFYVFAHFDIGGSTRPHTDRFLDYPMFAETLLLYTTS